MDEMQLGLHLNRGKVSIAVVFTTDGHKHSQLASLTIESLGITASI
jgi:hypothetical protein